MTTKKKTGRPTKFDPSMIEQAAFLCREGFTDDKLADFFKVDKQTIYNWREAHPAFFDSSKTGKDIHDEQVEKSLRERATGWTSPDGKFYPPDPASIIFWLKNRRPERWRDKQELEHSGGLNINVTVSRKKP
jgi:hypothetical protein